MTEIIPGVSWIETNILVETKPSERNNDVVYYRDYHKNSKYAAHVVGSNNTARCGGSYIRYLLGYTTICLNVFTKGIFRSGAGKQCHFDH